MSTEAYSPGILNALGKAAIFVVAGYATYLFLGQRPSHWCGSVPSEELLFLGCAAATSLIAGIAGMYRPGGSWFNKINVLMMSAFIFFAANTVATYFFSLGVQVNCTG